MKRIAALVALTLVACGTERTTNVAGTGDTGPVIDAGWDAGLDAGSPDAHVCPVPCGELCCDEEQICNEGRCEPKPCEVKCENRECGPDGCGGVCGNCGEDELCDKTSGKCQCVPETDAKYCARLLAECGTVSADDNCGQHRSVDCGTCGPKTSCDLQTHRCIPDCEPESDAELCRDLNRVCGPLQTIDRCRKPRDIASCGGCGQYDTCDATAGQCLPCVNEDDATFCQRNGRNCDGLTAPDNCGASRQVATCGTCTEPETCGYDGVCGGTTAPVNDSCAAPTELMLDRWGNAFGYGNNRVAANDSTGSCGGAGRDAVFKFTIGESRDVSARLVSGWSDLYVYLRASCDQSSTEVRCAHSGDAIPAELVLKRLPAGTWYLWVDSGSQALDVGPFRLELRTSVPPPAASNDTCLAPTAISFTGDVAVVTGDTALGADDYRGSCDSSVGNDLVYAVVLADPASITATVTRDVSVSRLQPFVYIRSTCDSAAAADERACARYVSGSATAIAPQLAAGTHYIVVDGSAGSFGPFTLTVTRGPAMPVPSNDLCANATPLQFNSDGETSVTGDTTAAAEDTSGLCATANGRDVVYSVELGRNSVVSARVMRSFATPLYQPAVYIRPSCTATADTSCGRYTTTHPIALAASPATLTAGTYYVFVDGLNQSFGQYTLEIVQRPPIANDTCASPEPLEFDLTGYARVHSNNAGATDDGAGNSCNSYSTAKDVIFSFTLSEAKMVRLQVTPEPGSTLRPAMFVRASCSDKTTELRNACAAPPSVEDIPVAFTLPRVEQGTYYVFVEGSGTGPFVLEAAASDVIPAANDTCATPAPIVLDTSGHATVTGDTGFATNGWTNSCGSYPLNGPDLAYSLELMQDSSVQITLTREPSTPSYRPSFSLRRVCDSTVVADEVSCAAASSSDTSVTKRLSFVPQGVYYLIVDGAGTASTPGAPGQFALELTVGPALAGDSCALPGTIPFDLNGTATLSATTSGMIDDISGCLGNGPDLVYAFTTTTDKTAEFLLTPLTGSFNPTLGLRTGACTSTTTLAGTCTYDSSTPGPRDLKVSRLAPGTYYLWVDSYTTTPGDFTLTATLSDPPALPANDDCTQPEMLNFTNNVAHVTGDTTYAFDSYAGTGSCAGTGANGRDLVYSFTLRAAAMVTVTAAPQPASKYRGTFYIRKDTACASAASADQVVCAAATGSPYIATSTQFMNAGTYYLILDGNYVGNGPFTLDVVAQEQLPNDNCNTPTVLQFDLNGIAQVTDDNSYAVVDTTGTCLSTTYPYDFTYSYAGKDLVYAFTLLQEKNISVDVTPASGATLKPAVFVRTNCRVALDEVGCNKNTSAGAAVNLAIERMQPGTYYVFVEGYSNSIGSYTLKVTATDPVGTIANDRCASASPVPAFVNDAVQILGTTVGAADDSAGSCQTATYRQWGGDLVYSIMPTADMSLTATLGRDGTSALVAALYVRKDCATSRTDGELACTYYSGTPTATSNSVSLTLPLLLAGQTYYLFVDGRDRTAGPFHLDLARGAPVYNNDCSAAAALLDLSTGSATVNGDTRFATNTTAASSTYYGTYANDVVYTIDLRQDTALSLSLVGSNGLKPVISLRKICDDNTTLSSEMGKAYVNTANGTANLTVPFLAPGRYFAWVDGYGTSATAAGLNGTFALTVTATAPATVSPMNDQCVNATEITIPVDTYTTPTFDLAFAHDDYAAGCATETLGADAVFKFTTTQAYKVTATVVRDSTTATFQPIVSIRPDCMTPAGAEVACKRHISGTATAVAPNLPAGTWYVFVDGENSTTGKATLKIDLATPSAIAPTNDNCTNPLPLTFVGNVATLSGTTTGDAQHDTNGSCHGMGATTNIASPDLVYSLTLGQAQKVTATMTAVSATYAQVIYLRKVCASRDAADEVACKLTSATGVGQTASISVPNVPAGTYYLWVDGGGSSGAPSSGDFTLQVTLDAVPAPVPGDQCSSALPLSLDTPVTGTTVGALNDYGARKLPTPRCDLGTKLATGPDLVYVYMPIADGPFTVTLMPTSSYNGIVWVTTGTCGAEAACIAASNRNDSNWAPDRVLVEGLAGQSYYVIVDGNGTSSTSSGSFTLLVQ